MAFLQELTAIQALFLFFGLVIALGFEFVNGFHDTANAVATVIYTRTLEPWLAVVWSGICNFAGVMLGGIGVAYSIVHLLPVEVLVEIDTRSGLSLVLALLLSAILWNLGTWYAGIPASSSHALIGSILGAALIHSLMAGHGWFGINWSKAGEVMLSLFLSPVLGFAFAAGLLLVTRRLFPSEKLHSPPCPKTVERPPWLIRAVLVLTCSGVSFAHGSNDGQKGMGLIMLILIGIVPTHFALDLSYSSERIQEVCKSAAEADEWLAEAGVPDPTPGTADFHQPPVHARELLAGLQTNLKGRTSFAEVSPAQRWQVRRDILELHRDLKASEPLVLNGRSSDQQKRWQRLRKRINGPTEYVPWWVVVAVALALGIGTTVGWKRIVITVGERIGKAHMTYAQGACAELVAMSLIGLADFGGFPVSTTHVVSSGVAGTMWANKSGVQNHTLKKLALAWLFTLPATMLLSALFFALARMLF